MNINRHNRARNNLGKALAAFFGCVALAVGLAVPAYGQTDPAVTSPENCVTGLTDGLAAVTTGNTGTGGTPGVSITPSGDDQSSLAAGCNAAAQTDGSVALGHGATVDNAPRIVVIEAEAPVATVPGVFDVTFKDVLYEGVTGVITIGEDSEVTLNNGDKLTITFDPADPPVQIVTVTAPVPGRAAIAEAVKAGGTESTAVGAESYVQGEKSVAIGAGASVALEVPAEGPAATVPGVFDVTFKDVLYEGVTGVITIGADSEVTLNNGDKLTITFDPADPPVQIVTVTAPVPGTPGVMASTNPVNFGTAIGADSSVTGDGGVAIGVGAEAGENQIRIGADHANVQIGDYNLGTIRDATATNVVDIGTNADGIATNVADIGTNADGIATNVVDIGTNADGIATNVADIGTNADGIATNVVDIGTNADGIATNVADIGTNADGIATNVVDIGTNADGIATNVADIGTNADGIATNVVDIGTNADGIATNVADIGTNADGIATNVADIGTNADDIETNTAGIATAVALAGLPVFKGGTGGWGIALGSFEGETAVAIGANYNLNQGSSLIRFGISTSSGGTSGTIGFGKGF